MTIIDAHAHLWQRARTPQDWIDPAAMPALDQDFWLPELHEMQYAAGIDGAILVQSVNSAQETRDLLAASEDQSVFGVVGWVDLDGDVPAQLDALAGEVGGDRLVGIRHLAHEDPDPQWLARPSLDFATLADRGLTFDLVVHPHQLAMAAQVVEANPNTRFVLDHLGNPPIASGELDGWRKGLTRLADSDNLVAKLSGVTLQTRWTDWAIDDLRDPVESALALFGPERLMFGTDWPLVMLASSAPQWVDIVRELVPSEQHEQIFSKTVKSVYLDFDARALARG